MHVWICVEAAGHEEGYETGSKGNYGIRRQLHPSSDSSFLQ